MNITSSLRGAPTGPAVTGMAAPAEPVPTDPAVNLVIEHLDEFASGASVPFCLVCGGDYVTDTPPVAA